MSLLPSKFYLDNFFDDFIKEDNNFGMMKCDIYEDNGKYHVEMDVPGFDKKDISIECENGYLTIEAQKDSKTEEKEKKYIRKERTYGKVRRQFYVGNVDESNVKAEFNNGVLKVTVPVLEEKNTKRKIEIE